MIRKLYIIPFLAMLALSARTPLVYQVDVHASVVVWTGYEVTGQHTGTVRIKNGTVQFTDGVLSGGEFEMDMRSVRCTDLDSEYSDKLANHLKSEDFFDAAKFPTARLSVTKVVATGKKDQYGITGNLTIKGITKEISFTADATENNNRVTAYGKMTIDRSLYHVRYGSTSFFDGLGDKAISDNFDLQISLSGAR